MFEKRFDDCLWAAPNFSHIALYIKRKGECVMDLLICGDLCPTDESKECFENEDARGAFGNVIEEFKKSDTVIVNLECAVTEHKQGIRKYGPCLKGPKGTVKTLKNAGVDTCMLSNNHFFDFGKKGFYDTLKILDENKMRYTGVGENYEKSRNDLMLKDGDFSVSVINVCEHEYSYATCNRVGTRPFDEFQTMEDIRKAKALSDYVIVIYHGGKEFCRYPSPRLMKACREMALCGADAVFCQHSHIIGCYEKFNNAHILYGQGNFHFIESTHGESFLEGLMVRLTVDKNKSDIEFIPVAANGKGIELAGSERKNKILNEFKTRNEYIKSGEWEKHWHDFCMENAERYKSVLCDHKIDDCMDSFQLFAHYLDCEAHTDVWREIFKTWNHTNEM